MVLCGKGWKEVERSLTSRCGECERLRGREELKRKEKKRRKEGESEVEDEDSRMGGKVRASLGGGAEDTSSPSVPAYQLIYKALPPA